MNIIQIQASDALNEGVRVCVCVHARTLDHLPTCSYVKFYEMSHQC